MQQLVSGFCVTAIFSDGLSAFDELAQSFLNLVDEYFVEKKGLPVPTGGRSRP